MRRIRIEKERASRSLRTAGPLLHNTDLGTAQAQPRIPNLCAQATTGEANLLRNRLRMRTPNRASRQIFNRRNAAPHRQKHWVPAGRQLRDPRFPGFLSKVQRCDANPNHGKTENENRESCQQFAHEIKLHCGDRPQKPPNPFATLVVFAHPDPPLFLEPR